MAFKGTTVKRLLPLMLGLAVLSACQMRVEFRTEVNPDGSGRFAVALGVDEELRELSQDSGEDPLADFDEEVPEGWETEPWTEGEFEGVVATRRFDSPEALAIALAELENSEQQFFQEFSLTRIGNEFRFSAQADPAPLEDSGTSPAVLESFIDLRVVVELPGRLVEHNADEAEDGRLVWQLSVTEPRTLSARSQVGRFPLLPALTVLAALVGLTVAWLAMRARRVARTQVETQPEAVEPSPATNLGPSPTADP